MAKRKCEDGKKEETEEEKTRERVAIEKTEAWQVAEFDHMAIAAAGMMPFLGAPVTFEEKVERMKEIVKGCPEFYPALFELAQASMKDGDDKGAKRYFDKCLDVMKMNFPEKELIDVYYQICEILEDRLRFKMAIEYYNQLMDIGYKASVCNDVSSCYVYAGDIKRAFEVQQKALELCDSNPRFYCNMGWIEMYRGNLDAAKKMLEKSLELDPKDDLTVNNYEICKMMQEKGLKNWMAYMLSAADTDYLKKLNDEEKYEESEKLIRFHNQNKVEAFKFDLLKNAEYTLSEKNDILFTLNHIFGYFNEMEDCDEFFYDDVGGVEGDFKRVMHRFIFKTSDVDEEIIDDVYTALLEFYKFLAKRKVIYSYKSLEKEMLGLKGELIEKMEKYNEVRHNSDYSEEEKEDIREELFEGDHCLF